MFYHDLPIEFENRASIAPSSFLFLQSTGAYPTVAVSLGLNRSEQNASISTSRAAIYTTQPNNTKHGANAAAATHTRARTHTQYLTHNACKLMGPGVPAALHARHPALGML